MNTDPFLTMIERNLSILREKYRLAQGISERKIILRQARALTIAREEHGKGQGRGGQR